MQKRFTELSFIIGSFFLIVSLILLIGYFAGDLLHSDINLYTGIAFLIFGLMMMLLTPRKQKIN